jgi:hypothetical protein
MAGYIGANTSSVTNNQNAAERRKKFTFTANTTALTGLSFLPNKIHIFHNGIRLVKDTDFTEAADGQSVTLINAAQAGDEVVAVTFAQNPSTGGYSDTDVDAHLLTAGVTLDATNDRVGMGGVTSPSIPLEVKGRSADGRFLRGLDNGGTDMLDFGHNGTEAFIDVTHSGGAFSDLAFKTTGAERMRILAGGGLTFNGDTAADNALDDYEQGTFNFEMVGYYGSPTPKVQIPAHYTKIGNTVHFWALKSSINSTGYSGNMWFTGLPFTAPAPYSIGNISLYFIGTYTGYGPHTLISGGTVYALLHQSNASSWSAVMHNVVSSNGEVYMAGTYKV